MMADGSDVLTRDNDNEIMITEENATMCHRLDEINIDDEIIKAVAKRKRNKVSCDLKSIQSDVRASHDSLKASIERLLTQDSLECKQYSGRPTYSLAFESVVGDLTTNNNEIADLLEFKIFTFKRLEILQNELDELKSCNLSEQLQNCPDISHDSNILMGNMKLKYQLEAKDMIMDLMRDELKYIREENKF